MDLVGPDNAVGSWKLSREAEAVLRDISETADETDARGIDRATIDALAGVGLLGSPLEPVARQRELAERLAMADASVWFSWAQHQTPLMMLSQAVPSEQAPHLREIQGRWLSGLQSGRYLGSVAFAHLRRPGAPNPVAIRKDQGWEISGSLDWVTSWDIADVALLMVRGAGEFDDHIVCIYASAGRSFEHPPGWSVHSPLHLLAMSGTHTRPMSFDHTFFPDSTVAAVIPLSQWSRMDSARTVDASPAVFGVARGALTDLEGSMNSRTRNAQSREREEAPMGDRSHESSRVSLTIDAWTKAIRDLRARAYCGLDEGASAESRVRVRAEALDLVNRLATASVVARAGGAMVRPNSAERRAREALFLQVQAQTAVTRAASLELLAPGKIPSGTSRFLEGT